MVKSGEDAGEKRRRILKGALVLLNDLPTGGFPLLNSRSRLSQERPAGNGNVLGVMLTGDESPKESTSALRLWLNCDRIPIAARSQCIVVIDEHTVLAGTDMIGESRADQCFGPSQNLEEDSAAVTIQ